MPERILRLKDDKKLDSHGASVIFLSLDLCFGCSDSKHTGRAGCLSVYLMDKDLKDKFLFATKVGNTFSLVANT